jgi:pimeloyl-ACP methyl ester carboxylesterase
MMGKLDDVVRTQAKHSPTDVVTLIGHSAGGVLGRMYLSSQPFRGRAYSGINYVDHLITLGSPHYNRKRFAYGGQLSRYVNQHYPGSFFSPSVKYTSVAGRYAPGALRGNWRNLWRYNVYAALGGEGSAWGDGLVPVESALLKGSKEIVLEEVSHFSFSGEPWYGSTEVIPRWWQETLASDVRHNHEFEGS